MYRGVSYLALLGAPRGSRPGGHARARIQGEAQRPGFLVNETGEIVPHTNAGRWVEFVMPLPQPRMELEQTGQKRVESRRCPAFPAPSCVKAIRQLCLRLLQVSHPATADDQCLVGFTFPHADS